MTDNKQVATYGANTEEVLTSNTLMHVILDMKNPDPKVQTDALMGLVKMHANGDTSVSELLANHLNITELTAAINEALTEHWRNSRLVTRVLSSPKIVKIADVNEWLIKEGYQTLTKQPKGKGGNGHYHFYRVTEKATRAPVKGAQIADTDTSARVGWSPKLVKEFIDGHTNG